MIVPTSCWLRSHNIGHKRMTYGSSTDYLMKEHMYLCHQYKYPQCWYWGHPKCCQDGYIIHSFWILFWHSKRGKASGQSFNPCLHYWLCLSPTQLTAGLLTSTNLAQRGENDRLLLWAIETVDLFWPWWKKVKRVSKSKNWRWTASTVSMHFISTRFFCL